MMGLCSLTPAWMGLAEGSCYTGISTKGKKQVTHRAWPSWAFGKRPLLLMIARGQQGAQELRRE